MTKKASMREHILKRLYTFDTNDTVVTRELLTLRAVIILFESLCDGAFVDVPDVVEESSEEDNAAVSVSQHALVRGLALCLYCHDVITVLKDEEDEVECRSCGHAVAGETLQRARELYTACASINVCEHCKTGCTFVWSTVGAPRGGKRTFRVLVCTECGAAVNLDS